MKKFDILLLMVAITVFCVGCHPKKTLTVINPIDTVELELPHVADIIPVDTAFAIIPSNITDKYWKLVELNGKSVSAEMSRTPYIMLNEGKINGSGGCNQFSGSYTIDEKVSRIRFSGVVMTQKACFTENVDSEFAKIIEMTDNYSISEDGNRLTLNRARMAPLAVFKLGDLVK